jgi:predicted DNA-binding ArsR family transcriptional regulator
LAGTNTLAYYEKAWPKQTHWLIFKKQVEKWLGRDKHSNLFITGKVKIIAGNKRSSLFGMKAEKDYQRHLVCTKRQ